MGKFSREQFEITTYLASMVVQNKTNRYLADIACMSDEWRQIMGFIEAIEIIDKYEPELTDQDKIDFKMIKEVVQKLGQSEFKMDIISHLAMKAPRGVKRDHASL